MSIFYLFLWFTGRASILGKGGGGGDGCAGTSDQDDPASGGAP